VKERRSSRLVQSPHHREHVVPSREAVDPRRMLQVHHDHLDA